MSNASGALAEELTQTKSRTVDGEWLEATIVGVEAVNATTVGLTVQSPTDEQLTWEVDKPAIWSDETVLVRVVEDLGYSAETIDHLAGESIRIRPVTSPRDTPTDTTDAWEVAVPDGDDSASGMETPGEIATLFVGTYVSAGLPIAATTALATVMVGPIVEAMVLWVGFIGWLLSVPLFIAQSFVEGATNE